MLHQALLAFSFLSLIGQQPANSVTFQPIEWPSMDAVISWQSPWVLAMNEPDPEAVAIVSRYLNTLRDAGFPLEDQGVWVQTGSTAIATHKGYQALSAASLTKIATTLAALDTWQVNHRFETWLGYTGTLTPNGIIQGDLVIRWEGDPYFVWEEAIALANTLQQRGIRQVTGNLVILGDFAMNFESDPYLSGQLFMEAVDADRWGEDAWWVYDTMPAGTPQPSLAIAGTVVLQPENSSPDAAQWLVRHQSLHLVALLKAMNIYSNNSMAEQFAQSVGGINAVMAKAVEQANIPFAEVRLINGSGLGDANRVSPRAIVAMMLAIQRQLRPYGLSIADVMPVFGQDVGTLIYRELPADAALKTGTLNTVSSLAGFFPTRDRGPVWFSVQNRGADLEFLRAQQDALLYALEQHWGQAKAPDPLQAKIVLGQAPYQLGDPQRNLPF